MPIKRQDALRALELLQEYHTKLVLPDEQSLRDAIERVIVIFKSRLFQALLDIQEFYEQTLLDNSKSLAEKTLETNRMADRWESDPPMRVRANGEPKSNWDGRKEEHTQYHIKSDVTITSTSKITPKPTPRPRAIGNDAGPTSSGSTDRRKHRSRTANDSAQSPDRDGVAAIAADEWDYEEVVLEKTAAGLGFSIAGGTDNPRYTNDPAIYVTKVIPGGAAENDGRLKKGDVIMRVNETDFTNVAHQLAVETLKKTGNVARLYIRRPRKPTGAYQQVQRIELNKGTRGLGFSIAGGVGNEHIPGDTGIFVTKIISGGAAQLDGRLRIGDKILSVGNTRFENVSHETAVAALKATSDRVVLKIAKATPDQSNSLSDPMPAADAVKPHRTSVEKQIPSGTVSRPISETRTSPTAGTASPQPKLSPTEITRAPRRITLTKGPAGLGFNIVGGEDGEGIYISYIVPAGVTDLSGAVFRGDQLLEVNGVDLCQATHEQAASALKHSGQSVTLVLQYRPEAYSRFEEKIRKLRDEFSHHQGQNRPQMPQLQVQPMPRREFYVRTLFDYDPSKDSGLPSRGLPFNYADILHVTNACDDDWWQTRKVTADGIEDGYGIIPSKKRVEKRERARRKQVNFGGQQSISYDKQKKSMSLSKKLPFMKSKDRINEEAEVEKPEGVIHSYEIVERRPIDYARPVVILGPLKDRINDDLLAEFPDRYASCVPHTSRPRRDSEMDGRDYHFVSRQQMEQDISGHKFIEAGQYKDNLYGTSLEAVRAVAERKKHCILDVSVNAVKRLRAAFLYPIVLHIRPYSASQICEWDRRLTEEEAERQYDRCVQTEQDFADSFTAVVQGNTPEEIYSHVKSVIKDQSAPVVWVPSVEQL